MTLTYGPTGEPPLPCEACQRPTSDRINGRPMHYYANRRACGTPERSGKVYMNFPIEPRTELRAVVVQKPREWLGERAEAGRPKATTGQRGTLQPMLRDAVAGALDHAQTERAVDLWNETMRGIAYNGGHRTALGILNGSFRHHGVPDLPYPVQDATAPVLGSGDPVWKRRSWLVYGEMRGADGVGGDLAGFDVNAMYAASAAIELGHEAPTLLSWPDDAVMKLPGWVQVSTLEDAPWSIGEQWEEGQWITTPLAAYLRDAGAAFLIVEALVWPKHRRWLDPHVNLMRAARNALVALDPAHGSVEPCRDVVAHQVLSLVKDVYTRMFGGLLASEEHNDTKTLRPDWRSQIIGTAQARMLRALDLTKTAGVGVAGINVDAAWFVLPSGYVTPPGLVVSDQMGKWKRAGRTPWTPDLRTAWQDGDQKTLWKALDERK